MVERRRMLWKVRRGLHRTAGKVSLPQRQEKGVSRGVGQPLFSNPELIGRNDAPCVSQKKGCWLHCRGATSTLEKQPALLGKKERKLNDTIPMQAPRKAAATVAPGSCLRATQPTLSSRIHAQPLNYGR